MHEIFITAAPVGAVPRRIEPLGPKYLSAALVRHIDGLEAALGNRNGWEPVAAGGLLASESTRIPAGADFIRAIAPTAELLERWRREAGLHAQDGVFQYHPDSPVLRQLDAAWFARIGSAEASRELVVHLTGQGWTSDGEGGLAWTHAGAVESYIPPDLVHLLHACGTSVVEALADAGWCHASTGFALSGKGASCWLPVAPAAIVDECVAAVREGAAILHLHTRERGGQAWKLPWSSLSLLTGAQPNRIVPDDYEAIVPRLRAQIPLAILNLSTSVRGGGDSDSAIRREHLRPYEPDGTPPELSSLSPGEVLFQSGGGYLNTPNFLQQQLDHARRHGIRLEIEVFNHTILQKTLEDFRTHLEGAGTPCLLMLVAGVDQYRRAGEAFEDDSLIPAVQRQAIFALLQAGGAPGIDRALDMAVAALAPVVEQIRRRLPTARISVLMPGPMQQLLPRVAVHLQLDGVRVGLEDGLTVPDRDLPGGLRKGRTAQQVRWIREELEALGCQVLSAEATRQALHMPSSAETLFLAAMKATASLAGADGAGTASPMEALAHALAPLRPAFERREQWLRAQLSRHGHGDPANAAATARDLIRQAGLYVRHFIEERDRYPMQGARAFRNPYEIQPLNHAWELLLEAGHDASFYEEALQRLAVRAGVAPGSFLTPPSQRKGRDLRFLEYIASLPCRLGHDRLQVEHFGLRRLPGYNAFMATLFLGMEEAYRRLRTHSESEPKSQGILAFQADTGDTIDPRDLQGELGRSQWVVLPCTTDTHYAEGIRQAKKLAAAFLSFLRSALPSHAAALYVVGFVHTGQDRDGQPLVEASLLHHRFLLGTDRHADVVSHASRLLYEAILLPRLVQEPERLMRHMDGTVARTAGLPLYEDGSAARRADPRTVAGTPPLRFLAHSSGIAALQQMDNAMRQDMQALGYSAQEHRALFHRNVVVSFASTADIRTDLPGTPTVDITAYNDVRSMAGTTTPDYVQGDRHRRAQARAAEAAGYRYEATHWKLIEDAGGKALLRRMGVFLQDDPARLDDGHALRRYLQGAPDGIHHLIRQLHWNSDAPHFDGTLRRIASAEAPQPQPQRQHRT
ncbi:3-keto-5-aminohexanoate cleavage protein [Acidovorax sacchari]|uniref:3-keto-5-aminohexanoate cleavage protein n=1 Tax=Acidovorax sacchari TaxID=3230736 RepID=UPI0039E507FB